MIDAVKKAIGGYLARALGILTLALLLAFAACGEPSPPSPSSTPTPTINGRDASSISTPPSVSSTPQAVPPPPQYDFATAPLEERIYRSDLVVRASLLSADNGSLRFSALEYLKGSGPTEITIRAQTTGRNTTWDSREAVLFLSIQAAGASGESDNGTASWWLQPYQRPLETSGESGSPAMEYRFIDTDGYYSGDLPAGYTIGTRNPMWIPAESGASGTSNSNPSFIAYSEPGPAGEPASVSLSDLRDIIAWMEGGDGVEGYDYCILKAVLSKEHFRDWELYYGRSWSPPPSETQAASGLAAGALIADYGPYRQAKYSKVWLTGRDAEFFRSAIVDTDEVASNGYGVHTTTARPLPAGSYTFIDRQLFHYYLPCNYTPKSGWLPWIVTVPPPPRTLHEAFFDPISLPSGVGVESYADTFTVFGSVSTSIASLKWHDGVVSLTLAPYFYIPGHTLYFIALDGSIVLSLPTDSATADPDAATLAWPVEQQPWQPGDLLMLRIAVPTPATP